ncbi:helix-turn-helix protein [Thalassoglobus neptunius]|uniref:Helix-turn-helix protein n=1 Tax=Thalassoglobus neptunius TaxID=1938619 RepID=A0A5C5X418_9PLAN|nr:helix-turn-helix transcriptional regulator [Thalassoglobus neptunius]TWT57714.1 helix-turn-helix protein [Thalassoglobus neptunius]
MVLQEEFRRIIRSELSRRGMSQRELARRIGITNPTVNQYLTGKICPGLDVVEKFFIALNLPLEFAASKDSTARTDETKTGEA